MEHIRYKKETEVVTFQGKEITLENLSPVFTPEQEAAKRRELEQQLYEVFRKYADKRQKEEALSLLKKWFPQMENFSGQLKKYKVTINDLLVENEQLEARAKASEKGKMKDTMERAKLKSELDNLQRLVDRIPPDILAELKRQQRHTVNER